MVPNMGGEPHCFGYLDSAGGIAETTAMVAARSEITFIQAEERDLKLQSRSVPSIVSNFPSVDDLRN